MLNKVQMAEIATKKKIMLGLGVGVGVLVTVGAWFYKRRYTKEEEDKDASYEVINT